MNSINQQQPEANRRDLSGEEAIKEIRAIVDKAKACFFCTTAAGSDSRGVRPMKVRQVDDEGHLWFLIANDSHTYQEVLQNPDVHLYFQGSPHSDFLHLRGRAAIAQDKRKLEELWEPVLKSWFTEGKDDPRIAIVRVAPLEGYYWDTKHGNVVAGAKMLVGAALGKTLDDSVEGTIVLRSGQRLEREAQAL